MQSSSKALAYSSFFLLFLFKGQLKVNHVCGKVYTEAVSSQTVNASAGERVTLTDGTHTVIVRSNYVCQALRHHHSTILGSGGAYGDDGYKHEPHSSSSAPPRGSFNDLLSAANSMAQELEQPTGSLVTTSSANTASDNSSNSSNGSKSSSPDSCETLPGHSTAQAAAAVNQPFAGDSLLPSSEVVGNTAPSSLLAPPAATPTAEPAALTLAAKSLEGPLPTATSNNSNNSSNSNISNINSLHAAPEQPPRSAATTTTMQQHWQLAESTLLDLVNSLPLKDVPLPSTVTPKDLHALAFQAAVLTLCGMDSTHAFAQAASAATLSMGMSPIPPLMGFPPPLLTGENVPPNFPVAGLPNPQVLGNCAITNGLANTNGSSSSNNTNGANSTSYETCLASRLRSRTAAPDACNSA